MSDGSENVRWFQHLLGPHPPHHFFGGLMMIGLSALLLYCGITEQPPGAITMWLSQVIMP